MDQLPDIAPFQLRLDELDAQAAEPSFYANARRAAEVQTLHTSPKPDHVVFLK